MEKQQVLTDLAQYKHIQQKVDLLWDTPELILYLQKLMVSDRENRQGFDYKVLFMLSDLLDTLRNKYDTNEKDIWRYNE